MLDPSNQSTPVQSNSTRIPLADPLMLIQHAKTYQLVLASIYSVAFVIGSTGNLYVISIVVYILRTIQSTSNIRHVLIYILCLSCVDLTVLMTIPFFVTDLLLTTWIYGKSMCKLYLTMESLSKNLSVFILTMLGADRFLAIRFPIKSLSCRKSVIAEMLICLCFIIAFAIILPIPIFGNALTTSYNATLKGQDYLIQITTCAFDAHGFNSVFVLYTFGLCYCLPALLILMFYSGIACTVCSHISGSSSTSIPLRRVMRYIFLVTGLYFVCWTPYWSYNILLPMLLFSDPNSEFDTNHQISPNVKDIITIVNFACHLLPFVNCAINPIIYALLNRELRQTLRTSLDLNEHRSINRWGGGGGTFGGAHDHRSKSVDSAVSHVPPSSKSSFVRLLHRGRSTMGTSSTKGGCSSPLSVNNNLPPIQTDIHKKQPNQTKKRRFLTASFAKNRQPSYNVQVSPPCSKVVIKPDDLKDPEQSLLRGCDEELKDGLKSSSEQIESNGKVRKDLDFNGNSPDTTSEEHRN